MRADGRIDEEGTFAEEKLLRVFTPEHPRPAYALKDGKEIETSLIAAQGREPDRSKRVN